MNDKIAGPVFAKPLRLNQSGMTLIEILAVIVLIGLILSVVAKGVFSQSSKAQARLNEVKMVNLQNAISQYRLEYGRYPGQIQDLIKQSNDVAQSGRLFIALAEPEDLKDVWGFEYGYKSENEGRSYSLQSLGQDGLTGGDGANQDITKRP